MERKIEMFLKQPFPLWETSLTADLVRNAFSSGIDEDWIKSDWGYNTVNAYYKKDKIQFPNRKEIASDTGYRVFLEEPSHDYLGDFYEEHGLSVQTDIDFSDNTYTKAIVKAFDLLREIPECFESVTSLVHTIQILKSDDAEIDISYSHPDLPFSIFLSICDNHSFMASCRVAESILHEAMHLKLTLIENKNPLIVEGSNMTFYSPWRDESRPLRGVLHGMFVFTAIYDFYQSLVQRNDLEWETFQFITYRIEDIKKEILSISLFPNCGDLTEGGRSLAAMLVKHLSS